MELLRQSKAQVLHHILKMQSLDTSDAASKDSSDSQHQCLDPDACHECNQVESARVASFHGYVRTDSDSAFLDVSGHAARIPVLSALEAKQRHRRTLKQRSDVRASRAQAMHALLHEQQEYTKRVLQSTASTAAAASGGSAAAPKSVAHVDFSQSTDLRRSMSSPETPSELLHHHHPSLDTVRAELEQEQRLLHERVQAKRQLELLTRQQTLAFHQEQKRMLGRVKNVKRTSFLATLQLDCAATTSTDSSAIDTTSDQADPLALDASSPSNPALHQARLRPGGTTHHPKNQDDDSMSASLELDERLRRQQRSVFLQSHDNSRLHFGGGFQSAKTTKTKRTDRSDAASMTNKEDESLERTAHEQLSGVTAHAVAIASTKKQDFETARQRRDASAARRKREH